MLVWLLGLVALFVVWIASANGEEPMLLRKDDLVARLQRECPWLPWREEHDAFVVKPVRGTSMGRGVDMESEAWTLHSCERAFGVQCMRQPYHSGPWEARITRNENHWDPAIAWVVPSEHNEPAPLRVEFPWQRDLQRCVQRTFPHTPFLSMDLRSNGHDLRVLEVNGAFGIPFQWSVGDVSFGFDMFRWGVSRAWEGSQHPERWVPRGLAYVKNQLFKFQTRHHPSRFWF